MSDAAMLCVRRTAACAIDVAIIFVILTVSAAVTYAVTDPPPGILTTGVWRPALLLNVSLPLWAYFLVAEAAWGMTIGKRIVGVEVRLLAGGAPDAAAVVLRNVVKLLPWEVARVSIFALPPGTGEFAPLQWFGLSASSGLCLIYFVGMWRRGGQRALYDLVGGTEVAETAVGAAATP